MKKQGKSLAKYLEKQRKYLKSEFIILFLTIEGNPAYLLIIYFVKQIKKILSKMFEKTGEIETWEILSKMFEKIGKS